MNIECADIKELELVTHITWETIKEIYPHYYPEGAVEFFLAHHSPSQIEKDIQSGRVFLLYDDNHHAAGTVTVKNNEICRLFVLPDCQKRGFGRNLLDFAENLLSGQFTTITLDASLPAKSIYLNKGYRITETHSIPTEYGDYLCYDVMEKDILK